jgi:peptide/nickel transport system substrate-binding protein
VTGVTVHFRSTMTRLAAVFAVAASTVFGQADTSRADDADPVLRLTVAATGGVDSLNPYLGTLSTSTRVFSLVYDFLNHRSNDDLRPIAGLATSWTTSKDGLTWTYRIASGMHWSDGRPLTSEDVRFTFETMMRDPDARTANGNFVATFASVSAPDPTTVVIRTTSPTATMLSLDVPILPAHVWRGVPDVGAFANDRLPMVGSGPFQLVEYRPGEFLRLTANKTYPGGTPNVDELVIRLFDNTDAAVQALRKGEVDLLGDMTPAQFDALAGRPGITRNPARGTRFVELVYNHGAARTDGTPIGDGDAALTDRRVRHAIDVAVDKQALVDAVLGGHGEVGDGYLPVVYSTYAWKPGPALRRGHDPAAADRILDAAGYRRGADGMRHRPDGTPLRLRLHAPTSRPYFAPTAERIAGWLKQAGIAVDLSVVPLTQVNEAAEAGRFDLYLTAWGVGPDPDGVLSVQTCDRRPGPDGAQGSSDAFYCDRAYDALYRRQLTEVNRDRRAAVVRQMQQKLYEDLAVSTLYYPDSLEAYRSDRVTGMVARPAGGRGSLIGAWAYTSAVQSPGGRPTASRWPWFAGGAGVLLLGAGFFGWRRRSAGDRR